MDVSQFVETYGMPGVVIVGLSYAVAQLWRAYLHVQERRLEDSRESAREIREIAEASNSAIETLRRAIERGGVND